jgi:hypothetical protein
VPSPRRDADDEEGIPTAASPSARGSMLSGLHPGGLCVEDGREDPSGLVTDMICTYRNRAGPTDTPVGAAGRRPGRIEPCRSRHWHSYPNGSRIQVSVSGLKSRWRCPQCRRPAGVDGVTARWPRRARRGVVIVEIDVPRRLAAAGEEGAVVLPAGHPAGAHPRGRHLRGAGPVPNRGNRRPLTDAAGGESVPSRRSFFPSPCAGVNYGPPPNGEAHSTSRAAR